MSQDSESKVKSFYENLINSGRVNVNQIGTFDQFNTLIQDESKRRGFYSNLRKDDLFKETEIGTWDQFNKNASQFSPAPKQPESNQIDFAYDSQGNKVPFDQSRPEKARQTPKPKQGSIDELAQKYSFENVSRDAGAQNDGGLSNQGTWDDFWKSIKHGSKQMAAGTADAFVFEPKRLASKIVSSGVSQFYPKEERKASKAAVEAVLEANPLTTSNKKERDQMFEWADKGEDELKDNTASFLGSLIPQVGLLAISVVSRNPSIASGYLATMYGSSFSQGTREYEKQKEQTGEPINEYERLGMGLVYGAAEYIGERIGLQYLMPKGTTGNLSSSVFKSLLKKSPQATKKLGNEMLDAFKRSNPKAFDKLVKKAIGGSAIEGGQEVGTELIQAAADAWIADKNMTWDDIAKRSADAFKGGALMGGVISPLSVHSQQRGLEKNREKKGATILAKVKNGKFYEILNEKGKDEYLGVSPDNEFTTIKKEDIEETLKVSKDQFDELRSDITDSQADQIYQDVEQDNKKARQDFAQQIRQETIKFVNEVGHETGHVVLGKNGEGKEFYVKDGEFDYDSENNIIKNPQQKAVVAIDVKTGERTMIDPLELGDVQRWPTEKVLKDLELFQTGTIDGVPIEEIDDQINPPPPEQSEEVRTRMEPEQPKPIQIGKNLYNYTQDEQGAYILNIEDEKEAKSALKELNKIMADGMQAELIEEEVTQDPAAPFLKPTTKTLVKGIRIKPIQDETGNTTTAEQEAGQSEPVQKEEKSITDQKVEEATQAQTTEEQTLADDKTPIENEQKRTDTERTGIDNTDARPDQVVTETGEPVASDRETTERPVYEPIRANGKTYTYTGQQSENGDYIFANEEGDQLPVAESAVKPVQDNEVNTEREQSVKSEQEVEVKTGEKEVETIKEKFKAKDQLLNKKDPKERVYFDKVSERDGKPIVELDYIFNDNGKLRQDKRYVPIQEFKDNYTGITESQRKKLNTKYNKLRAKENESPLQDKTSFEKFVETKPPTEKTTTGTSKESKVKPDVADTKSPVSAGEKGTKPSQKGTKEPKSKENVPDKGQKRLVKPDQAKERFAGEVLKETSKKVSKEVSKETSEPSKAKTIRKGKKKPLSKNAKKAVSLDVSDARSLAMQYFVGGGKINYDALFSLFGTKGKENDPNVKRRVESERKRRFAWTNYKQGESIDNIAHQLWEKHQDFGLDTHDFRDAVEDVILSYNSTEQMAKDLIEGNTTPKQEDFVDPELLREAERQANTEEKDLDELSDLIDDDIIDVIDREFTDDGKVNWEQIKQDIADDPGFFTIFPYGLTQEQLSDLENIANDEKKQRSYNQKIESLNQPESSDSEQTTRTSETGDAGRTSQAQAEQINNLQEKVNSLQKQFNKADSRYQALRTQPENNPKYGGKGQSDIFGNVAGSDVLDFGLGEADAKKIVQDSKKERDRLRQELSDAQIRLNELKENDRLNQVRFSRKGIERSETPKLVPLHNIDASSLREALNNGGLIAPSLAIVNIDYPFTDFGDITLVGSKSLIDPETGGVKVFTGDVYSPTVPRPLYNLNTKELDKWSLGIMREAYNNYGDIANKIANEVEDFGSFYKDLRSASPETIANNQGVENSIGLMATYLIDTKQSFRIPMEPTPFRIFPNTELNISESDKPTAKRLLDKYRSEAGDNGNGLTRQTKNDVIQFLKGLVDAQYQYREGAKRRTDIADKIKERIDDTFGDNTMYRLGEAPERERVNEDALRKRLIRKINKAQYRQWIIDKANQFQGAKYFEKGNKKIPYTSENILDAMIGNTRGQQKLMTYGLNKARSYSFKQLKNIPAIQKAKDNLTSKEKMNEIDEAYKAEYFALADKLDYQYSDQWDKLDDLGRSLADYFKGKTARAALSKNGFNPSGYTVELFQDFAERIKSNPVDYFEAKMQRIVPIEEFTGAVVPRDTPQELVNDLKKAGLRVRKYDTPEQRQELVDRLSESKDVRFSLGFYSPTEKALNQIKQAKGTPGQMKAMLLKNGAKQAELDWMGWDDKFSDPTQKVTKNDIQDWIDENRIEVKEVEKGRRKSKWQVFTKEAQEQSDKLNDIARTWKRWDQWEDELDLGETVSEWRRKNIEEWESEYGSYDNLVDNVIPDFETDPDNYDYEVIDETKYQAYTLPGGDNYKELLLILTTKKAKQLTKWEYYKSKGIENSEQFDKLPDDEKTKMFEDWKANFNVDAYVGNNDFKSEHFDERNILVHIRFKEREVNGERVLFIEEIQSDWSQSLKKGDNAINTPFKQTPQWVNLAFRRMIRYAAENGFDRIAWTTGEQQADRYDLSKQVDKIAYQKRDKGYFVSAIINGNGNPLNNGSEISEDNLEEYVGKEVAQKIVNGEGSVENYAGNNEPRNEFKELSGLDLKVGGEGMKAFYNQIIPKAASKLGKKFGAKVEPVDLQTEELYDIETGYPTVLSLPITNKLRTEVLSQGQPLFIRNRKTPGQFVGEMFVPKKQAKNRPELNAQIRDTFDKLNEAATRAVPINYVETQNDLPLWLRDMAGKNLIPAVYYDGRVTVVIGNIESVEEAVGLWIHEQGVHHGIRLLIPDQATRVAFFEKIVDDLGMDEMARVVHPAELSRPKHILGEEYIAYLAQQRLDGKELNKQQKSAWKRFIEAINDFINRVLNKNYKITEADVLDIARDAINANFNEAERRSTEQSKPDESNRVDTPETVKRHAIRTGAIGAKLEGLQEEVPGNAKLNSQDQSVVKYPAFVKKHTDIRYFVENGVAYKKPLSLPDRMAVPVSKDEFIREHTRYLQQDMSVPYSLYSKTGTISKRDIKLHVQELAELYREKPYSDQAFEQTWKDYTSQQQEVGKPEDMRDNPVIANYIAWRIYTLMPDARMMLAGEKSSQNIPEQTKKKEFAGELFASNQVGNQAGNQVVTKKDITQTKAFKEWFGESKVVDENGRPLVVYHGTNADFNEFALSGQRLPSIGYGYYFSTNPERAENYGQSIMPAYLKVENLLDWDKLTPKDKEKIRKQLIDVVPDNVLAGYGEEKSINYREGQEDEAQKILDKKEEETKGYYHERAKARMEPPTKDGYDFSLVWMEPTNLEAATSSDLLSLSQRYAQNIANVLGYDGAKQSDQIVVFSPTQIKSATGNRGTFDPGNPDIRFSLKDAKDAEENSISKRKSEVQPYVRDFEIWLKRNNRELFAGMMLRQAETAEELMEMAERGDIMTDDEYRKKLDMLIAKEQGDITTEAGIIPVDLDKTKLGKLKKKYLSVKGYLPKDVFMQKVFTEGKIRAMLHEVETVAGQFKKALKDDYGKKINKVQIKKIDSALKGELPLNDLPENTREAVRIMRRHIDLLSKAMIDEGVVEGELVSKVSDNMGVYVTRSYKTHNDKRWNWDKIPDNVKNDAIAFLRAEYPEKSEPELIGLAKELVDQPDLPFGMIKQGKLGSKDLSILIKRKDIAPPIRALLGEIKDPLYNYGRSVAKMANLISKHKFLTEIRQQGMGKYLFDTKNPPDDKHIRQIAAEGSRVMEPLNGLYTTPEIAEAFEQIDRRLDVPSWGLRQWMKLNGLTKYGKTILSPITHIRNFISNFNFHVANGHFNPSELPRAMQISFNDMGKKSNKEFNEMYQRYLSLGIVRESTRANEMQDVIRDALKQDMDFERVTGNKFEKFGRGTLKFFEKAYQMEDDVHKIFAFETERKRYKKAYPEWSDNKLDKHVAEIIRNVYPTYSMVPNVIQGLRRFPLIGSFVSFPSEVLRNTWNTAELAMKEIKNPKTKSIGIRRMSGLFTSLIMVSAMGMLSRLWNDVDDDDDDSIKRFLAPWNRNSNLIYLSKIKGGVGYFVDVGYSDPQSMFKKPVNALLEGNVKEALRELSDPFVSTEIFTGAALEVYANKKRSGSTVYNPSEDIDKQVESIVKHLWKTAQPGVISQFQRLIKASRGEKSPSGIKYDLPTEVISLFLGQRRVRIDVVNGIGYKVLDFNRKASDASKIYNDVLYSENIKDKDKQLDQAYERADRIREAAFEELRSDFEAALRLGASKKQLNDVMDKWDLAKYHRVRIVNGRNYKHLNKKH